MTQPKDLHAVIFGTPALFTFDFQYALLKRGVHIANSIPHLAKEQYSKPFWKAVALFPEQPFILPVQGYMESLSRMKDTCDSYYQHGKPANVFYHPTDKLDEPGTRSDKTREDYFMAKGNLEIAEQENFHPLVTHPYPVPGIAPADWMRPKRAGWRLMYLEQAKAMGLTPDMFGCEEWCGYLIDADFAAMVDAYNISTGTPFMAERIGQRLRVVGASWLLINDLSELDRLFTLTDGKFTGLTDLGEALLDGLKAVA